MKQNGLQDGVKHLRNYLQRQTYQIPSEIFESNFLQSYLVQCDQDVRLCETMLDNYFHYKQIYPEYFLAEDPNNAEFQDFFSNIFSLYMPELTIDGHCVFVDKVTWNEKYFDMRMIMKCFCMETEIKFIEGKFDSGDVILFDCNKLPIGKVVPFIPFFIRSLTSLLEVFPLRIKLFVIINLNLYASLVINGIKKLMTTELRNKFYVYSGDYENFLEHVSVDVLPAEYRGVQSSLTEIRDAWLNKLRKHRRFFIQQCNERIPVKNEINKFEMFYGCGGSFKRLMID